MTAPDHRPFLLPTDLRARCRDAVPEWAPELRAALAALEAP